MRALKNLVLLQALILLISWIGLSQTFASEEVAQAVVRITSYRQSPDWSSPWRMKPTAAGHGSGFLIENGWILTNAHVVSDSKLLLINKLSSPEPFLAEVVSMAHDSDLALLRVKDAEFYTDMTPLAFGGIPKLRSPVQAYGYPLGGQDLSRTEGVVSRIEFGTYIHPGIDSHLLVQTDSAINPGNSGGPVIQEGLAIGVAFQSNLRLNDIGYFIPVPLIKRFIQDQRDGHYDGVPEIGIQTSSLLNRYYRKSLGLSDESGGVLVERIIPRSSAEGILEEGDVLLGVAGKSIDRAGMVHFGEHRVDFFIEAEHLQVGDSLFFKVWRNRSLLNLQITLKPPPFSAELRNAYDILPEYLIVGGLVLIALNRDYLQSEGKQTPELSYEHWYREIEEPHTRREQVVLISRVLPASVNSGYSQLRHFVVHSVNGNPIKSLRHLEQLLEKLPEDTEHLVFESEWEPLPLVLNYRQSLETHQEILEIYGIPSDRRFHKTSGSEG